MTTRDIIIDDILIPSLNRLYQEDYDNIRLVNENDVHIVSRTIDINTDQFYQ